MKLINIESTTIPDAWFQCIYHVLDYGFKYKIQHGSYIGEERLEFDWVTIFIKYPYQEPYDQMLPQIPESLGIPNPVENGYIEQYLPYLMTGEKKEDEDYTYGQRITDLQGLNQIEHFISLLKKTPNTNQAVLQISRPYDCMLTDPPCLRHIDLRIKQGELIFYPYFRSWDLWGGMPANLAGIAVLQKYMADEIGVKSGPICASSKGLHIYSYVANLAKIRAHRD